MNDEIINEAKNVRASADSLRDVISEFAEITNRRLLRATWQGVLMIMIGIILSVSFLGYLGQPYTCDPSNLLKQDGSARDKVCTVIFPTIRQQKQQILGAQQAAQAAIAKEQEFKALEQKIQEYIDAQNKQRKQQVTP